MADARHDLAGREHHQVDDPLVSDGPAHELLKRSYPSRPSSGRYLYELFKKESKNFTVPRSTIHDFTRAYYDSGTDPIVPYIQTQGESITASGSALFQDDRFVGSLSPEETKMMLLLQGSNTEGGDIKQALKTVRGGPEAPQVMLTFVNTKQDYKVLHDLDRPHIRYDVAVEGQIIEYTGKEALTEDRVIQRVERELESGLETRMRELLGKLQHRYATDPLGIGAHLRASGHYRPWSREKWHKLYPQTKIDVNFNLRIVRIGQIK